ncbi:MAG: hypothetical protein JO227_11515, partial [Acetobacteraceae bacterium]|nr:hypothetical protein [Acetobacteraceae bacterium]
WALIDFMHANNAGTALHRTGQWPVPIRAPGVPLVCDNASIQELADLRGSVVLVIADEPESNDAQVPDVQPQDGARVVSLHLGRGGPGCTAATHAAWEAFAILTGIAPEHFVGTALLTDPGGWLRTVWPPGQRAEWTSPDRLTDAVRQIGSSPIFNAIGELHEPHH